MIIGILIYNSTNQHWEDSGCVVESHVKRLYQKGLFLLMMRNCCSGSRSSDFVVSEESGPGDNGTVNPRQGGGRKTPPCGFSVFSQTCPT